MSELNHKLTATHAISVVSNVPIHEQTNGITIDTITLPQEDYVLPISSFNLVAIIPNDTLILGQAETTHEDTIMDNG